MSTKKKYIKDRSNRKIRRLNHFLLAAMYLMAFIVLYDSYIHRTPLFYVVFYFAGLVVGRIFRLVMVVERLEETNELVLKTNRWDLVLTILLILFRFVYGISFLESMHIVWASDALYLFFIGVYRSKWKGIVRQIDEIVYQWIAKPDDK